MKFSTKAIREGQQPDPATGAVITPLYQSVNFVFKGVGKPNAFEYSRSGNPTRTAYEKCLASLEEAKHGLAFSSGMAAIDAAISFLRITWSVRKISTAGHFACSIVSPRRAGFNLRMSTVRDRRRLSRQSAKRQS
jgi:cystathionine beta-lyase/cystathionine gamma-synthase